MDGVDLERWLLTGVGVGVLLVGVFFAGQVLSRPGGLVGQRLGIVGAIAAVIGIGLLDAVWRG